MSKQEHSQTEGKHLGFRFHTDYTDQSGQAALEILVVRNGHVQDFWHPADHALFLDNVNSRLDDIALKFLRKQKIKTIYTPGDGSNLSSVFLSSKRFLDLDLSWLHDEDNWGYHLPLDQRDAGILKDYGINLVFLGDKYLSDNPEYKPTKV